MAVEFRVLGDVQVRVGGRVVDIGHARQRCVLAALLVEPERPVPVERLLDRAWGERLPQRARETLHGYLSRLRQALAAADHPGPVRQPAGYLLAVDPMAVDLHRFQHLLRQARSVAAAWPGGQAWPAGEASPGGEASFGAQARPGADAVRSEALYREALALWHGEAFAGLDTPWFDDLRVALHRQRLGAELARNELVLARGGHTELLDELTVRAAEHPLDERLCGQLMVALYRSGRQSEALEHYHRFRLLLADRVGADPGAPLCRLHRQILTGDPALTLPTPRSGSDRPAPVTSVERGSGGTAGQLGVVEPRDGAGGTSGQLSVVEVREGSGAGAGQRAATTPVPRQLPPPPPSFTGRCRELADLDRAMTAGPDGRPETVVISAIGGLGGIGKTWLAVRWAYQNLARFPDGQLYLNLRGFDPASEPVPPSVAVRALLDALGVPAASVPPDPDAQTGLYRSLIAGRRMLVLLDNARDTEQILPLLPGTPSCAVLVTSRNRLAGLLTGYGARPLALDALAGAEARDLLTGHLGATRVAAEGEAVDELVRHCAGLPLALGIVAARAALDPGFSLRGLAGELREEGTRLDALDAGELAANLRAVLACSRRALSADAARLFELLGLAPGPDVGLPAVASLAGLPVVRVRRLVRELTGAHLLHEHLPDRYRMHDLVRLFAGEQVRAGQPGPAREEARHRLLDHYLHTAHTAAKLLDPHRDPVSPAPARPGVTPERLTGHGPALEWFAAEHTVLLAAVQQPGGPGFDRHRCQLARTLTVFFDRWGRWDLQVVAQRAALAATDRLADRAGQAQAHRLLARAYLQLGRYDEADRHLREALELFVGLDDRVGQAYTQHVLARVFERRGRYREALEYARRSLALHRATGHDSGQANALNSVGWFHSLLGDHEQAIVCCEPALRQLSRLGDRHGQATTWDSLGFAYHHLGRHGQAVACYHRALDLFRDLGARYQQADTLAKLGDAEEAAGNPERAGHAWRQALDLLRQLHHPDAAEVGARLHRLDVPDRHA
ncbi:AfsR/SARP family transcriptional regulator [Plantactinospora endophytica]|uniref:SARP family transcriptional regulator n=1 Tax=Plantactinospora endophytica TaxID=673535 RepID=A0ABQ4ECV0_9ACTN|nr:tetratricopeptide repeat protein [Plantactinospora endophytica]GIG92546.1 SARP family transcriptional regulator [Plantactinospora endophytica]